MYWIKLCNGLNNIFYKRDIYSPEGDSKYQSAVVPQPDDREAA